VTWLLRYIRVEQIDDVRWRLLAPVIYLGVRGRYTAPSGYITDFASVPRILWWLVPPYGRYTAAAVIHDWLLTDLLPAGGIASNTVDAEFRRAMQALGVGFCRRWVMWAGVRWAAVISTTRRPGWVRTLPLLLLVSALTLLPVALVAALLLLL
jgi:hypothetical protein